ncbi:hypothetical protein NDU88_007086 [Pleurodeles waltl]|uniref:Transposase DDE domain-containing protein n=1 Tax=Pleurodeles waltl TaxID=8319 RepID=A0AAV7MEQ9_PLEWA|nr:hypothetical protein NDU88_007086 [Pleurodeles waltl]
MRCTLNAKEAIPRAQRGQELRHRLQRMRSIQRMGSVVNLLFDQLGCTVLRFMYAAHLILCPASWSGRLTGALRHLATV